MSTRVDVRSYRRPDQPQPVYPQVVDAVVAKWIPVFDAEMGTRTTARAPLDLRFPDWQPEFTWPMGVVDATVATWGPVFQDELLAERSRTRAWLDVRDQDWSAEPAWIFNSLTPSVTTAQIWPALLATLTAFRMGDGARLDVRRQDWSAPAWIPRVVDGVVATWPPTFDAERSSRTPDGPRLDVRLPDWSGPPAWIFQNLPGLVTQAQLWPAILQALGLNYRTLDRSGLDVRRVDVPPFSWATPIVDLSVASWLPAFVCELGSLRTGARALLDVRQYEWSPPPAWIFQNLPALVTQAQLWPAILQALGLNYRQPDGGRLDVRGHEWAPELGWLQPTVDRVVSSWSPIWQVDANTFRTIERGRLDVRRYEWSPEAGWALRPVDPIVASWSPIFNAALRSLRTPGRPLLETTWYEWSPENGWLEVLVATITVYAVSDASVTTIDAWLIRSVGGNVSDPAGYARTVQDD